MKTKNERSANVNLMHQIMKCFCECMPAATKSFHGKFLFWPVVTKDSCYILSKRQSFSMWETWWRVVKRHFKSGPSTLASPGLAFLWLTSKPILTGPQMHEPLLSPFSLFQATGERDADIFQQLCNLDYCPQGRRADSWAAPCLLTALPCSSPVY